MPIWILALVACNERAEPPAAQPPAPVEPAPLVIPITAGGIDMVTVKDEGIEVPGRFS